MPTASSARRAADDEVVDILDEDSGRITVRALVQQGVSAVLIGFLGLFALAGVSTVAAPYSAAAAGSTTAVAGSVDVTRAEPVAAVDGDGAQAGSQDPSNNLDDPTRNDDISRNTLRVELNKAVSAELQQQRNDSLAQVSGQVAAGAQTAAADQRAAELTGQNTAITGEQTRLQQEAAAKAAAAKVAVAAGTLTASKSGTAAATDSSLAGVTGSGSCTTPFPAGSYVRGASFGAYGSWSRYHTGVDLVASYGTPIRAACDGVVLAQSGGSWAGINVAIAHPGGGATLYAHMSSKTVSTGQTVKAGQVIGYVGLTGRTFGPHCHFEYYPNPATIGDPYTATDPAAYLLRNGVRL